VSGYVYIRGGQLPELREPHLSSHFGQEPRALVGLFSTVSINVSNHELSNLKDFK
jgi:hypothetical protein